MNQRPISSTYLDILHNRLGDQSVTPSFHAFCHLTPIPDESAQALLSLNKDDLLKVSTQCHRALSMWLTRRTRTNPNGFGSCIDGSAAGGDRDGEAGPVSLGGAMPAYTLPSASCITPRSGKNVDEAYKRDSNVSVVSHFNFPIDVAHIFSYSLASRKDDPQSHKIDFYRILSLFFGAAQASTLQMYILGDPSDSRTMVNRLENLITLTKNEHFYFGEGKIVLEPVDGSFSPDGSSYLVQLHKLPGYTHTPAQSNIPINYSPSQLTEDEDESIIDILIVNRSPRYELQTDARIRLVTDDPRKRPLPDPGLLRLHAALSRVVRMAGRAGVMGWEWDDGGNKGTEEYENATVDTGECEGRPSPKSLQEQPTHPEPHSSTTAIPTEATTIAVCASATSPHSKPNRKILFSSISARVMELKRRLRPSH